MDCKHFASYCFAFSDGRAEHFQRCTLQCARTCYQDVSFVVSPCLELDCTFVFQLRWLTRRPVSKSHQLQCAFESTVVSAVPAEVVDAKTSLEGSPVEFLFMFFIGTSKVLHRAVDITRSSSLPTSTWTCLWGYGRHWSCHCNATATHIALVRTPHATFTGTSTYDQKSWSGHTRCDLAPLTTSFGTVGQWERQHLAMAGSRHHHSPRNATAHRAARANYHVPLWRSGLAVPASCWSTRIPEGFRRMSTCAAVFPAYRRSRLFAVVFVRAFQRDCALRGFCSSSIARATTILVRAACKIPTISSALLGEIMVFFHGVLSVISLWLETIFSLFPCCLPLRAVRLWYLLRAFSQAQRFWRCRKIFAGGI